MRKINTLLIDRHIDTSWLYMNGDVLHTEELLVSKLSKSPKAPIMQLGKTKDKRKAKKRLSIIINSSRRFQPPIHPFPRLFALPVSHPFI